MTRFIGFSTHQLACTIRNPELDMECELDDEVIVNKILEAGKTEGPRLQMSLFLPEDWTNANWPMSELHKQFKEGKPALFRAIRAVAEVPAEEPTRPARILRANPVNIGFDEYFRTMGAREWITPPRPIAE